MIRRLLSLFAASLAALTLSNCAAPGSGSDAYMSKPGSAPWGQDGTAKRREARSMDASPMAACTTPQERTGLSTGWGNKLDDKVGTTVFEREPGKPAGVAKLYYNNTAGAQAMAGSDWSYSNSFRDYAGGIFRVGLRNHRGAALSAYQSGQNLICIGEDGQRYSVQLLWGVSGHSDHVHVGIHRA